MRVAEDGSLILSRADWVRVWAFRDHPFYAEIIERWDLKEPPEIVIELLNKEEGKEGWTLEDYERALKEEREATDDSTTSDEPWDEVDQADRGGTAD